MTKPPASEQRPSRRNCIGLMTRAELAIFDAAQEVEKAGADVRLTDAINLLHQAREKVGDFVDGIAPAPALVEPDGWTEVGGGHVNLRTGDVAAHRPEQPARGDGAEHDKEVAAIARKLNNYMWNNCDHDVAPVPTRLICRMCVYEFIRLHKRISAPFEMLDDAPGKEGAK